MEPVILIYLLVILLAFFHTLGEVLYKFSTMLFSNYYKTVENKFKFKWKYFYYLFLIGLSIGVSLCIKIIYGILLGENPLSIISGIFLGFITIFSILLGKLVFKEEIKRHQAIGMCFITIGIVLLV